MSGLRSLLAASLLVLGAPGGAAAAALSFRGTLELQLRAASGLGASAPNRITGQTGPGGAVVNGSSGLGGLQTLALLHPLAHMRGSAAVPVTDPAQSTFVSLRATAAMGTGVFAPIAGGVGPLTQHTAPVTGIFRLCALFTDCRFFVPIPLARNASRAVGVGGIVTFGGYDATGLHVSVFGAPWTIRTATLSAVPTANGGLVTTTAMGFAHGPASLTGSTASPSGVVQLVTPIRVHTNLATQPVLALFGTLTIHLTPEPGTLLLVASGLAALALGGRRRRGGR